MKQEQYNQTKALQKHLTQKKWWSNPKLKDLWVTTHLGTKALVICVLQHDYILLDRHYNQLKVHNMRVKESREVVVKKHDTLCKFITEISPKVKKKKKTLKAMIGTFNRIGTVEREIEVDVSPTRDETVGPESNTYTVHIPHIPRTNVWGDYHYMGDLEDDIDE